jgi:hypothetical protein
MFLSGVMLKKKCLGVQIELSLKNKAVGKDDMPIILGPHYLINGMLAAYNLAKNS